MKPQYILSLFTFILLAGCSQNVEPPQTPVHKKFVFQHDAIVPEVTGESCHEGWVEDILGSWDRSRDKRLSHYHPDPNELVEASQRIKSRVNHLFEFVGGQRQEQLEGILEKMKPYLPAKHRDIQIFYVRHRMLGDSYINAFTHVGGYVYVSTGLWETTDNIHEVALVVGHELAHQANGHTVEMYRAKQRWLERLSSVGMSTNTRAEIATVFEELLTVGLGQEDEAEADLGGSFLCAAAGYDPVLGSRIFNKFATIHNPKRSLWSRLSASHPRPTNRKACLSEYLHIAQDSADAVYQRELVAYQKEVQAWERSNWKRELPGKPLPIGGLITGVALFGVSRKRRVKPIVGLIGVVLTLGCSTFLAADYINLTPSTLLPQPTSKWITNCEYAEGGCNETKRTATVTTMSGPLNIRSVPFADAEIVSQESKGTVLKCHYCSRVDNINGKDGRWCRITTNNNIHGWAWGHYLVLNDE